MELANQFSAQSPYSVAGVLNCVVGAENLSLEEALIEERKTDQVARTS
jgi:hypothetical protein